MSILCALGALLPLLLPDAAGDGVTQAMAALFGKAPHQADSGEPDIHVGIASGLRQVQVLGAGGLVATWTDDDGIHRRVLPAGARVTATLMRSHGAPHRWVVPLSDGRPASDPPEADTPLLLLRHGLQATRLETTWQETGAVWPLFVGIRDLRQRRLVAHVPSHRAASALVQRLHQDAPELQAPELSLTGLPHGTVRLVAQAPGTEDLVLGMAHSLVTLAPDASAQVNDGQAGTSLEVLQVPFGMGYPWAGQEDRSYRGFLQLLVGTDGTLTVVNRLPLEAYLRGVVAAEMPAGAPETALQAQAIAARSNVVFEMGHRHRDMPFDFCAEQHCQVYGGRKAEDKRTDQAIAQSAGAVLVAQGQVVHALFSADCGGRSEDNDVPWPQRPSLFLRSVDDRSRGPALPNWRDENALMRYLEHPGASYCGPSGQAASTHRPWRRRIEHSLLTALWAPHLQVCGALQDVLPGARGPGGRLLTLTLRGKTCDHVLQRELPIRQALGGLPSAAFAISQKNLAERTSPKAAGAPSWALELIGTGWGHGVGLCQRGAMGRARAGASAAQILAHYYAAATVERLYNSEETSP